MAQTEQIIGKILQETYRIERLIGEGGMGAVYEASHLRLRRRFAIKLLFPQVAQSSEAVARFRREGEVTSELGHPNIIEIIDLNFTPEGAAYIVMELLTGESLCSRIQGGRLPLSEVSSILRQAASALAAAHNHGVIHRDLKPPNIFIARREDGSEIVKVLDFGISKVLGSASMMTGTSALLGTPNYMAPEQAEGHAAEADARTDIFALGAILYEMLAGRPAFLGQSVPSILYQVVHAEPPALQELRPDLPQEAARVVSKAMSKKPGARHGSIEELAQDFARAVGAEAVMPPANQVVIPPTAVQVSPVASRLPATAEGVGSDAAGAGSEGGEAGSPAVLAPTIEAPPAPAAGPVPVAPLFPRTTLSGSVGELQREVLPRRNPVLIMGIVVAAAALVGSGVYLATRPDAPAPKPKVALGPGATEVRAEDMTLKPDSSSAPVVKSQKVKSTERVQVKKSAAQNPTRPAVKKKKPASPAVAAASKKKQPPGKKGVGLDTPRRRGPVAERGAKFLKRRRERKGLPGARTNVPEGRSDGREDRIHRPERPGGYGELRVTALVGGISLPAIVYVDGKRIKGRAPVRIYRIAAGEHTVQIEVRNFKSATKRVNVRANNVTTALVKLNPAGQ